ncbi:MAG: restriction endonuclease subunit S [Intestinibacter sp.]|uniref:restriction endonuclease subunit S n=1 Tax=Intestinibacter sp. TaxID=1965304 RepID=UPI002A7EB898|nr:restriction endonuclease subunit S [Intestinibacter sp.]MDY4574516.1 restriction endonuclease subunit S [Intestinibacter sp.]
MSCNEWKEYSLDEICRYRKQKISIEKIDFNNYISTENMLQGKKGVTIASNIPKSKNVDKYLKDDILISNIRPYFKKIWYADKDGGASSDVLIFYNIDDNILDNKYLYYLLSSDDFFNYVISTSKGTKMPRGDKDAIMKYKINLPSLQEQIKISNILSSLDNKVELNNEMNKILEEMAQSIFKRWFVEFEFPNEKGEPYKSSGGEMYESEQGMIPKGWKVKIMSELIEVKDGTHASPKVSKEGYPLVTSKHIKGDSIAIEEAKLISEKDYLEVNKRSKVDTGDILISMIGTVGLTYLVQEDNINFAIKNIGLFKTSQNMKLNEYIYLYLKSQNMKNYIESRLAGTTQRYISLGELRSMPIIYPNYQVIEKFKSIVENLLKNKRKNIEENKLLMNLRETLLPKFMNGDIKVD